MWKAVCNESIQHWCVWERWNWKNGFTQLDVFVGIQNDLFVNCAGTMINLYKVFSILLHLLICDHVWASWADVHVGVCANVLARNGQCSELLGVHVVRTCEIVKFLLILRTKIKQWIKFCSNSTKRTKRTKTYILYTHYYFMTSI